MRRGQSYSEHEDAYILANYKTLGDKHIADYLGREIRSIRKRREKLGILKHSCKRWTPKEDEAILAIDGKRLEDMAKEFGRCSAEVSNRAKKLGIEHWGFYKNNGYRLSKGYEVAGFENIKRSNGTEWRKTIKVHHVVAASNLGRPIADGEIVHHINGNKRDNRKENIHVFSGRSSHRKAHLSIESLLPELHGRGIIRFNIHTGEYELC